MHRTGPNCQQKPGSAAVVINPLVLGSAVIGSGAHVAIMAMVNNASGIRKAFLKLLTVSL